MGRPGLRMAGMATALCVLGGILAGCSSAPANGTAGFTLTLSAASLSVPLAGRAAVGLQLASKHGFAGPVALSLVDGAGHPAFAASVSPSTVTLAAGQTTATTVKVAVTSSLPVGTFDLGLKATSGGVGHTVPLTLVLSGSSSAHGSFTAAPAPPMPYATGDYAIAIAAGYFDANDLRDVATADNATSGTSTVFLGDGSGGFTVPSGSSHTVGANPTAVAVADFNGDGVADLAVANGGASTVSVLLGKGDGTFEAQVTYTVGFGPEGVVAGDLNGDGKPDLAFANGGDSSLGVLLNTSSGGVLSFVAPSGSPFALGFTPTAIAEGDLDGDGVPDLAITDNASRVWVELGNGDGTFQTGTAPHWAVGTDPWGVTVADLNGDGMLDLATANHGSNDVSVLLNATSGGSLAFANAVAYAAGTGPASVAVGDFNADGRLDLAVPDRGSDTVSVLLGQGNGTFPTSGVPAYTAGGAATAAAVADLDGDGVLDLAVVHYTTNATMSVLLGQ